MEPSLMLHEAVLAALAAVAVVHDLLFRRIPNGIVLAGIALGLLFQTYAPNGEGLFCGGTGLGLGLALLGGVVGLAAFLPLYLLRAMGAGDVKLLAMMGVWLGPQGIAWAALWTLLAGGVLSIAAALWTRALRQVLANLVVMIASRSLMQMQGATDAGSDASPKATGRLPYALAIVAGLVVELVRMRLA